MNRTTEVFDLLEDFLELETPLSEQYSIHKLTGVFGLGDTSEFIKSGSINRLIRHESIPISSSILEDSTAVYESASARLSSLCRCLPPIATTSPDPVPVSESNGCSI
jgi:hypothetical protein